MRAIFLLAVTILSFNCLFAQKGFEPGYYIDSEGQKVECLVRVSDLNDVNSKRSSLQIKRSNDAQSEVVSLTNIVEIGIPNDVKLQKFTIAVDDAINGLNNNSENANYKTQIIFLNVLLEGKASLYSYDHGQLEYFYSIDGNPPIQLIHKKYVKDGFTKENNSFRQELMTNLRLPDDVPQKFITIGYFQKEIAPIVQAYNNYHNGETVEFKNERKQRGQFTYSIFVGAHYSKFQMIKPDPQPDDFNNFAYCLGGELGFLNAATTWEFIFRAELESVSTDFRTERGTTTTIVDEYELQTIAADISLGARYFLNSKAKNKIYVEALGGMNFPFSDITFKTYEVEPTQSNLLSEENFSTTPNVFGSFGLGCTFGERYSVTLRYDTDKTIANKSYSGLIVKYNRIGINVNYRF